MLVACRLAGLSALEAYYAGVRVGAQCEADPSLPTEPSPDGGQRVTSPDSTDSQHASIPFRRPFRRRLEASLTSRSRRLAAIKAKERPSTKRWSTIRSVAVRTGAACGCARPLMSQAMLVETETPKRRAADQIDGSHRDLLQRFARGVSATVRTRIWASIMKPEGELMLRASSRRRPSRPTSGRARLLAYLSGAFSARAPSAGFIRPCQPFLAVRPPAGLGWLHEVKHEGYRIVARKDGDSVRLWTRYGADFTDRLPRVAEAVGSLPADRALIDGEAVLFRPDGRSDFGALRTKAGGPPQGRACAR